MKFGFYEKQFDSENNITAQIDWSFDTEEMKLYKYEERYNNNTNEAVVTETVYNIQEA